MHHGHNTGRLPACTTAPPKMLLATPPRPSRLVFRQPYAGMAVGPTVDGANMDLDAMRRLRSQLEYSSRATARPSPDLNDDGGVHGVVEDEQEAPDVAEDEYDDDSVVVKHHGQRRLPVLQLRCRWRKPPGHSRLMTLYLKLRQKVLTRASKFIGRFSQAKAILLHPKSA